MKFTRDEVQARPELEILANNTVYDHDRGCIVGSVGTPTTAITVATSPALHLRRAQLKHAAIMAGARAALERNVDRFARVADLDLPDDGKVLAALGDAAMEKALNPKDAKQIDAARYIEKSGGYSEDEARPAMPGSENTLLAALLARLLDAGVTEGEIIAAKALPGEVVNDA